MYFLRLSYSGTIFTSFLSLPLPATPPSLPSTPPRSPDSLLSLSPKSVHLCAYPLLCPHGSAPICLPFNMSTHLPLPFFRASLPSIPQVDPLIPDLLHGTITQGLTLARAHQVAPCRIIFHNKDTRRLLKQE